MVLLKVTPVVSAVAFYRLTIRGSKGEYSHLISMGKLLYPFMHSTSSGVGITILLSTTVTLMGFTS